MSPTQDQLNREGAETLTQANAQAQMSQPSSGHLQSSPMQTPYQAQTSSSLYNSPRSDGDCIVHDGGEFTGFPTLDEQSVHDSFKDCQSSSQRPQISPAGSERRVQISNDAFLDEKRKHNAKQRMARRDSSSSDSSSSDSYVQHFSFQSRRRGFSRSSNRSTRSQRSLSPLRQTTEDSDKESLKSVGETDEDVCFPMYENDEESRNVKITELDQLLNNLSDSEAVEDDEPAPGSDETCISEDQEKREETDKRYDNVISPSQLEVPFIPSKHSMKKLELPPARMGNPVAGRGPASASQENLTEQERADSRGISRNSTSSRSYRHRASTSAQALAGVVPPNEEMTAEEQRFSFFATKMESTIHAPDLASLVGENESFSSLFDSKNGIWWLDCYDPTDMEMKIISRAFGIHPLTAEDIRTEESREKFELFKNYYFVSFHTFESDPNQQDTYLEPINFYMIVYGDGVLSFHFTQVEHCRNVRRRMRQLRDYVNVTSDWVCYALIDDIVDSFAPVIHEIEGEADEIEDLVYINTGNHAMSQTLARLVVARRKTMSMIRLLSTKADVIKMFAKRCNEHWKNMPGSEIALFLGDIQDHIVTMYQNLSAYEKIFSRSHVNYMAQLQVEFVNSSNRMTNVLGKATLVGTILVPMNLITGLFGMNVQVPGQDGTNLHWFFGILGLILFLITACGIVAHLFMRRLNGNSL